MRYNDTEKRFVADVPANCPLCGREVNLSIDYARTIIVCDDGFCDFSMDATEEFEEMEMVLGL